MMMAGGSFYAAKQHICPQNRLLDEVVFGLPSRTIMDIAELDQVGLSRPMVTVVRSLCRLCKQG